MTSRLWVLPLGLLTFQAHADPAAWHLTGQDGADLWLLGSVHYLRDSDYPLPDIVDRLYAQADAVVMEIDLDDIDTQAAQSAFRAAATLPPGTRLSNLLAADIYASARTQALSYGIDLASLDRFEPWLVAVTIMDVGMRRLGFRADRGVEQYVLGRALGDGKQVLGLETLNAQIAVFDGLGPDQQQALLEQTLHELDSAEEPMTELVAAWRRGELEPLAAALMSEFGEFPQLYESLVVRRNLRWISELEKLLDDGRDFLVVVGALHLVGPNNVVELLRERGFEVTALR